MFEPFPGSLAIARIDLCSPPFVACGSQGFCRSMSCIYGTAGASGVLRYLEFVLFYRVSKLVVPIVCFVP